MQVTAPLPLLEDLGSADVVGFNWMSPQAPRGDALTAQALPLVTTREHVIQFSATDASRLRQWSLRRSKSQAFSAAAVYCPVTKWVFCATGDNAVLAWSESTDDLDGAEALAMPAPIHSIIPSPTQGTRSHAAPGALIVGCDGSVRRLYINAGSAPSQAPAAAEDDAGDGAPFEVLRVFELASGDRFLVLGRSGGAYAVRSYAVSGRQRAVRLAGSFGVAPPRDGCEVAAAAWHDGMQSLSVLWREAAPEKPKKARGKAKAAAAPAASQVLWTVTCFEERAAPRVILEAALGDLGGSITAAALSPSHVAILCSDSVRIFDAHFGVCLHSREIEIADASAPLLLRTSSDPSPQLLCFDGAAVSVLGISAAAAHAGPGSLAAAMVDRRRRVELLRPAPRFSASVGRLLEGAGVPEGCGRVDRAAFASGAAGSLEEVDRRARDAVRQQLGKRKRSGPGGALASLEDAARSCLAAAGVAGVEGGAGKGAKGRKGAAAAGAAAAGEAELRRGYAMLSQSVIDETVAAVSAAEGAEAAEVLVPLLRSGRLSGRQFPALLETLLRGQHWTAAALLCRHVPDPPERWVASVLRFLLREADGSLPSPQDAELGRKAERRAKGGRAKAAASLPDARAVRAWLAVAMDMKCNKVFLRTAVADLALEEVVLLLRCALAGLAEAQSAEGAALHRVAEWTSTLMDAHMADLAVAAGQDGEVAALLERLSAAVEGARAECSAMSVLCGFFEEIRSRSSQQRDRRLADYQVERFAI